MHTYNTAYKYNQFFFGAYQNKQISKNEQYLHIYIIEQKDYISFIY